MRSTHPILEAIQKDYVSQLEALVAEHEAAAPAVEAARAELVRLKGGIIEPTGKQTPLFRRSLDEHRPRARGGPYSKPAVYEALKERNPTRSATATADDVLRWLGIESDNNVARKAVMNNLAAICKDGKIMRVAGKKGEYYFP